MSEMAIGMVGLGVMGFHSFLQSQNVPWESVVAKVWNRRMFRHIREQADLASRVLAEERGPCPDAAEAQLAGQKTVEDPGLDMVRPGRPPETIIQVQMGKAQRRGHRRGR